MSVKLPPGNVVPVVQFVYEREQILGVSSPGHGI